MVEAIRSYHARRGRLSPNQREALETLGPGLDLAQTSDPLDLDDEFGRVAPRTLEIGSGLGDTAIELAAANPDRDYIAADVHTKGIARTLILIQRTGLTNLRVLHADALDFLTRRAAQDSLREVLVFFPDPWPKARHNKRRLVRREFADAVVRTLETGGVLHLATDDREYADAMRQVLAGEPLLEKVHDGARITARPRTKYELAGEREGRHAIDLLYVLRAAST
ncbi:MAG: tRNA (guanosine(46)-N7)-methyltransferase TrmB [Candidatus Nanopelagicales bacterium]